MQAEIESTIPLNLIRPRAGVRGVTPAPDADVEFVVHLRAHSDANLYAGLDAEDVLGIFVPTYRPLRLGTLVVVAIDVPGRDDLLVVNTVVRWTREGTSSDAPPGLGLEFLHLGSKARQQLGRFVRCRTPLLFEA